MTFRIGERICTAAAVALVLWAYWWTLGAVGGLSSPGPVVAANDYYNHLVAGFSHGHLYMDMPVDERLKSLADPYDPVQNQPYRATDASYYHGHYYLYFGAAPAVTLLLPFHLLTGNYLPTPWAILIFCWVGFLAATGLWLQLRARYFGDSPAWTAPVGVLLLGIGTTASVLVRRPFFWELATAGGFAFSMLAVFALFQAIHRPRRAAAWLFGAGVFLGLAVASRPTFIYAIPALALPLLAAERRDQAHRWRMALAAAAGIGVIGIAVFGYNLARFGNGFEFGHNYLLSVAYESKVKLFGLDHFLFNARMYFTLPGQWSWHPPFFAPIPVTRAEMPPGFYTVDDPVGLLPIFPVALLALAAPFAVRGRDRAMARELGTMLAILGIFFVAVGAVILLYVATIPRYAVDFLPGLALLAAVGLLATTERRPGRRGGAFINAGVFVLAVGSLLTGAVALGSAGQLLTLRRPDLLPRIEVVTTRLEALRDRVRGIHYGPVEFTLSLSGTSGVETLLTAGPRDEPDRVILERVSAGKVRLGVQHASAPIFWTAHLPGRAGETHRLRVELGSFYPPLEHGVFAGIDADRAAWIQHRAELRYDDAPVLRTFAPFVASREGAPRTLDPRCSAHLVSEKSVPADLASRSIDSPENLLLTFILPAGEPGRWPLLTWGRQPQAEALWIEQTPDSRGRLAYAHGTDAPRYSAPFALGAGSHRVELRETEYGWTVPVAGERLLVAWFDGALVWKQRVPAFGATDDELTIGRNTLGIPDCAAELTGVTTSHVAPTAHQPEGGSLLMRVMFPPGVKSAWRPVLALGRPGAADTLSVYYMGLDVGQFRLDHWAGPMAVGASLPIDKTVGHDIEIWLPTFAATAFGHAATGDAWVTVDGREALRVSTSNFGFAPTEFALGVNQTHAMMDDRYFRGAFVQRQWTGTASPTVP